MPWTALKDWILTDGGTREQLTITIYDQLYLEDLYPNGGLEGKLGQRNLRNRVSYSATKNLATDADQFAATFYTYDIHGNVDTLLQDYKGIVETGTSDRYKKIGYDYDLISGKVNRVSYQVGHADAFYHRYRYDAENRLTTAETSRDELVWETDASYQYYKYGPLARTVLGQLQVQGMDYAYTLQGWLKGVNGTTVGDGTYDMGQDGVAAGDNAMVARDVLGFALHYYDETQGEDSWEDYKPIHGTATFARPVAGNHLVSLYNGNIGAMTVNNAGLLNGSGSTTNALPLFYNYRYDQLNRITRMQTYSGLSSSNVWTPVAIQDYREKVSYDPNGNILKYNRHGSPAISGKDIEMDSLTYHYYASTNRLKSVDDSVGVTTDHTEDLEHQSNSSNYTYDAIGNLKTDVSETLTNIDWTVYGKIASIVKSGNTISYTYDAAGNRISKTADSKTTLYVRDASGNVMSVYEGPAGESALAQKEAHLYGSSRLGMTTALTVVPDEVEVSEDFMPGKLSTFTRGEKLFELSNHL
ncbi:MAG TPA: hypothetical protein VK666_03540, partial [Chryseolinea sp.]|nr:hypothetical protein [Chryseolinea sp.]